MTMSGKRKRSLVERSISQCLKFFKRRGKKSEEASCEEPVGFGEKTEYVNNDEVLEGQIRSLLIAENQELFLSREPGKSVLSKAVRAEQEAVSSIGPGGAVEVKVSALSQTRSDNDTVVSWWAIDSATLPWKPQDDCDSLESASETAQSVEEDESVGTSDVPYLIGLFTSLFQNKNFKEAAALMEKIQKSGCDSWDMKFTLLECKLYLNEDEDQDLDKKVLKMWEKDADEIDILLAKSADISTYNLIRLALELVKSGRHYGAIILCRSASLRLPLTESQDEVEWVFNLAYFFFVEITLRVITVVRGRSKVTEFVFCCMNRLLNRMMKCVDHTSRDLDYIATIAKKRREKIAQCYNALAYCCHKVGMYEGAAYCCLDGLKLVTDMVMLQINSEICADLRLNLAVARLGLEAFEECECTVIKTIRWLQNSQDAEIAKSEKDEALLERLNVRLQVAIKILDEFQTWNEKRQKQELKDRMKATR